MKIVQPDGWAKPRGYVNGMVTSGWLVHVAGQVGWEPETGRFEHEDLVGQFGRAMDNVLAVVEAAGGQADSVVRMTIYVTDIAAYRQAGSALAPVWRERFGRHYPAMALIGVAALVEPMAVVEIEAVAEL